MQRISESHVHRSVGGSSRIFLAGCVLIAISGEAAFASATREVVVAPLNSRLWRSEFQPGVSDSVSDSSASHSRNSGETEPHVRAERLPSGTSPGQSAVSVLGHPAFPGLSDADVTSLPSTAEPWRPEQEVIAGGAEENPPRLSDWDQAAAFHSVASGKSGVKGPSLTTYLVAFAAAVVLLGSVLSPK